LQESLRIHRASVTSALGGSAEGPGSRPPAGSAGEQQSRFDAFRRYYNEVRKVRYDGTIKWRGRFVFIGEAFACEPVGLCEQDNGAHLVRFCNRDLGVIRQDLRLHRFVPPRARPSYVIETKQ